MVALDQHVCNFCMSIRSAAAEFPSNGCGYCLAVVCTAALGPQATCKKIWLVIEPLFVFC
jgi:hypothetical protein